MSIEQIYRSVGGQLQPTASRNIYGSPPGQAWNFGWVPLDDRDLDMQEYDHKVKSSMPKFAITGNRVYDEKKVCLFDLWKHPTITAALGFEYPGTHQLTGSCFPAGTPVRLADGTEKAIELIRVGDQVITHKGRARPVVEIMSRQYTGDMISLKIPGVWSSLCNPEDTTITATADHQLHLEKDHQRCPNRPLETPNWQSVSRFRSGDQLLQHYLKPTGYLWIPVTISEVTTQHVTDLTVYDFEVQEDHSFIANRVVSKNCVGAGGGNALASLIFGDIVLRGDVGEPMVPFWLLPYGRSRMRCGLNGPGEGSTGTAFAEACREDGLVAAIEDGLPRFENKDGLVWGEQVERQWSDGRAQPANWLERAKKYLVGTTAELKSADAVRQALCNLYPVTIASGWGGEMTPRTQGNPAVLLNKRVTTWNHQMSVHAWWEHPSLGEIFWIHNQWGLRTHGICPSGAPGGGFWVLKSDIDWICRQGEVFAFSGFPDFPARKLNWYF